MKLGLTITCGWGGKNLSWRPSWGDALLSINGFSSFTPLLCSFPCDSYSLFKLIASFPLSDSLCSFRRCLRTARKTATRMMTITQAVIPIMAGTFGSFAFVPGDSREFFVFFEGGFLLPTKKNALSSRERAMIDCCNVFFRPNHTKGDSHDRYVNCYVKLHCLEKISIYGLQNSPFVFIDKLNLKIP